jgi:citronellyl-CoA synthetase
MSHQDVITWPQFAAKIPNLIQGLPGLIKGLKVGSSKDKTRTVGLGWCIEQAEINNPNGIAIMESDVELTYTQFNAWTNRLARYLLSSGLSKGDTVAVMIENRAELLAAATACAKIGVVAALINTSQRGKVLTHSINLVSPKAVILGEELLNAYNEVNHELVIPQDKRYFFADTHTLENSGVAPEGWHNLALLIEQQSSDNLSNSQNIFVDDPLFYIYTSGTTGMPKAVIFNHGRFMKAYGAFGFGAVKLKPQDRLYVTLPFYHATAMAVCWGSVLAGNATLIMRRKFSASQFWADVKKYQASAFGYVGELCRYLLDQPKQELDSLNGVRLMVGNGLRASIWEEFQTRFKVESVLELYASSEGNIGFTNFLNFKNTVGLSPFPYAIVKYDKENECPERDKKGRLIKVKKGEAGLLIGKITDKTPFHGYTDKSKTEKSILRNAFNKNDAWFDTGDLMRPMGFRHAQFVDRLGDTFRWKGENVSTTEVELIVDSVANISETVVYGVEIPNTNGRAGMASIRLDCEESQFDFKGLLASLKSSLPMYAVPVFLRISDEVDTTGTFKHKKAPLKEKGFDLNKHNHPIYVWLPKSQEYVPLCEDIQGKIEQGYYQY